MGAGQTFNKIQNSIINSSSIEPFECFVLNIKEFEMINYFKLEILLSGEINDEFIISKQLYLNMKSISNEKEDENISLTNSEEERTKSKNSLIIPENKEKKNFYITIYELKGIVLSNHLYCEILKFRKKEKNIYNINIIKNRYFHFMKSIYVDSISSIYNKKEKILFSIYLNSLKNEDNEKESKFEDFKKTSINLNKKLESNKVYFFYNLFYEPDKKNIIFVEALSNYEEINSSFNIKIGRAHV